MPKEMLINTDSQEVRLAVVNDGLLEELYFERTSSASHLGNIYKGRITNVEASIQAAFVDFGLPKNGFLHISDIHPQYFPGSEGKSEAVGRKRGHKERPPIQECLKRGMEVVVQLTKEGIGTKGPTLTTYLSIPGRVLVMMPGMSRLGISRKIEDTEARAKARDMLADIKLPKGIGFIMRTAGLGRTKKEVVRDLNYLTRLWESVEKKIETAKAPAEIYQDSDLVTRTIRDIYNTDIDRIICDSESVSHKAKEFLQMVMPRTAHKVELYQGDLFHDSGLDGEIEKIYSRKVDLPSGGSLIIDQTEALVAIDINSGRFRKHSDAEATGFAINMEAAVQIARQLRLRDMGGVIIIDFIDMYQDSNNRAVEKALRDAMKPDRAKTKMARISGFGILEMTRQRVRPSITQGIYSSCPYCGGEGQTKSMESLALQAMRSLKRVCINKDIKKIDVSASPSVAQHLLNAHRVDLGQLEEEKQIKVSVLADAALGKDDIRLTAVNARGSRVSLKDKAAQSKCSTTSLKTVSLEDAGKVSDDKEKAAKKSRRRRSDRRRKPTPKPDVTEPAPPDVPAPPIIQDEPVDKELVSQLREKMLADKPPQENPTEVKKPETETKNPTQFTPAEILAGKHHENGD